MENIHTIEIIANFANHPTETTAIHTIDLQNIASITKDENEDLDPCFNIIYSDSKKNHIVSFPHGPTSDDKEVKRDEAFDELTTVHKKFLTA